jgi:hypothetical protein
VAGKTRRPSLRVLTEIAEDVLLATAAVARLSKGQNGAAVTSLVRALEREIRRAATVKIQARRRSAAMGRDTSGRFNRKP